MKNRTKTIALLLDYPKEHFGAYSEAVASGVIRWGAQNSWDIINLRTWLGEIPGAIKVDGLIHNQDFKTQQVLTRLLKIIPCSVEIHPHRSTTPSCGIDIDQKAVGLQAADYYLNRGFRNFAIAAYRTDSLMLSLNVFKERIEQAGGQCQSILGLHLDGQKLEDVSKKVKEQLRKLTYPLGIFCANDRLAVRLCRWCIEEGIAVPEQAAILGYGNDIATCGCSPVGISSINPHFEQHGFEAAKLLQRMMDGESIASGTIVRVPPSGIITRRSTDIMAIPDARVARALRYIWDHYARNISPDDVASYCGISRRNLDRYFEKAFGRTVAREIIRQRLQMACELLVGENMDVASIAAKVGFRTPQYFNFQFKRHFGLTPQRYRERERKIAS